jgi:hypothetical protein
MINTNADYIIKRNHYDNLVKIQMAINHGETCVLYALSGKHVPCMTKNGISDINNVPMDDRCCAECIAKWLNQKKS